MTIHRTNVYRNFYLRFYNHKEQFKIVIQSLLPIAAGGFVLFLNREKLQVVRDFFIILFIKRVKEKNEMKKKVISLILLLSMLFSVLSVGCGNREPELNIVDDKYRNFYEIFVYSYCDSDGDGIGDIQGLISKLDYLNDGDNSTDTDLGINGIWLMPIAQSTTYHKYDVVDYTSIDSEYGTMEDFQQFIEECHARGINVIIDLVINHSSSQNMWFQEACNYIIGLNGKEPSVEECKYFDYYNFTQEKDSGVYYPVGDSGWYYEAQFGSEMPDINLESELVRAEFAEITQFWFDKGVDGFRLDAVGEYYSGNTTRSVDALSWFVDMVKSQKEDVYLVGEAWDVQTVYSQFYASGIDSMFNFDFSQQSGTIANAIKKTSACDASVFGRKVEKLQENFGQYNENYIDAPFYTNHDTGRSAGYYAGEFGPAQTKMAIAMNQFMSGASFIYYGEELGMKGAGRDENKRAPMQWSSDTAAEGMCNGPAAMEEVTMKYGSLEEQQSDPLSIYNYTKQVLRYKNMYPEIARGSVDFIEEISTADICVFKKQWQEESILIIYNISENENIVDVTDISLGDSELEICGSLLTTYVGESAETESTEETQELIMPEELTLENGQIKMSPYSVVLLK